MDRVPGLRLFLLAVALGLAAPRARAAEPVDVLLVLAADVSRSITPEKFDLQRKGYAAAVADPQVLDALEAGPKHRIAVAFVEWSGDASEQLVVDWTMIASENDAKAFGAKILGAPRAFADRTAIGSALRFSADVLARSPFKGDRKVIDLSGDGINNSGSDVVASRDAVLAGGVSAINGVVILSADTGPSYMREHTHPPGGLQGYYRANVIGGVGSFVLVAQDFESFGRSLVAKLLQEISWTEGGKGTGKRDRG